MSTNVGDLSFWKALPVFQGKNGIWERYIWRCKDVCWQIDDNLWFSTICLLISRSRVGRLHREHVEGGAWLNTFNREAGKTSGQKCHSLDWHEGHGIATVEMGFYLCPRTRKHNGSEHFHEDIVSLGKGASKKTGAISWEKVLIWNVTYRVKW